MNDTDQIDALADTLYDALYAITPYAEPHFADETEGLKNAVRVVLAETAAHQWVEQQLEQTGIRSMDFRNGMHMDMEPARELLAHWVAAARTMLGDAPNYTETKLEMDVKVAESPEMYTLVIQRHAPGALTPHEARQKAEARVAELEAVIANARKLIGGWTQSYGDHVRISQVDTIRDNPHVAGQQMGRANQYSDCANELRDVLDGEDPDGWDHGISVTATEASHG